MFYQPNPELPSAIEQLRTVNGRLQLPWWETNADKADALHDLAMQCALSLAIQG